MNIEQKIKEIEDISKEKPINDHYHGDCHWEYVGLAKEALEVINLLQSEVERYKSLWETNAAESKEIMAELKRKLCKHDYILTKQEKTSIGYITEYECSICKKKTMEIINYH